MHPLIKLRMALKGLTLFTGCQLLNLQLSLLLRSSKRWHQETLFFRYVAQKCGQPEKGKRARVTVILSGHEGIRDREVNTVLQRSKYSTTDRLAAQRTMIKLIYVELIAKEILLYNKLKLICS